MRVEVGGRKAVKRYCSNKRWLGGFLVPLRSVAEDSDWKRRGMYMPFVASEACWRKTVEVDGVLRRGIWQMSIGMERRWQAKMEFMIGIY